MAFPASPLGIKVQMNLQGRGWTDIVRDDSNGYRILTEDGITITRGHSAEQQRTTASTMDLTILDPRGVFNNQNPRSPFYGILPRNVPIRAYTRRPVSALWSPTDASGSWLTVSSAAMNVAGDIDVIVDFDVARLRGTVGTMLVSKWVISGNQRSWAVWVNSQGKAVYSWSPNGTTINNVICPTPLPPTGRISLRVLHDVVNGANNIVFFSTAPTYGGTYTPLAQVVTAGNVTVFASTATLEVGAGNTGNGVFFGCGTLRGRIYTFQVTVNGSVVAFTDFTTRSIGSINYVDAYGNTWNMQGGPNGALTEITDADYRFYGEVSSLPQSWDPTGKVVKVKLEASGVIRRLDTNATPVRSPIYKNFINLAPTGYWTAEDGTTATVAGSSVTGSNPATLQDITFTTDATLPGSAGVMQMGGTGPVFVGTPKVSTVTASTLANCVVFFKFPSIPVSNLTLFSLSVAGGSASRVDFVVETAAYRVNVYDVNGAILTTAGFTYGTNASPTNWIGLKVGLTPNGATTDMDFQWYPVGSGLTYFYASGAFNYAGRAGRFSKLTVQGLGALNGVKMAHLLLTQFNVPFVSGSFIQYSQGYAGELAADRWRRVLADAGIDSKIFGLNSDTEAMGPQPFDTTMNILYECADVDGGEIVEPRARLGLDYRTRVSMQNQYGLGLNYGTGQSVKQLSGELNPVPDDLNVANDITLSRRNGASVQVTLDSGPMSTLDPTLGGIGRVQSAPEINNYLDTRLQALAQYMLGLSTWPDARYPTVQLALHRSSAFAFYDAAFTLAANTDVGDIFGITNLPIFLPPDALVLMARGMTETFSQFNWDITYNATPGRPYTVTYLSDQASETDRADSSNTVLNASLTSTATSASFSTPTGALCVTTAANPAEFPFDVMIAGERVTVTAITGTSSPQAATLVRSVNGIVKAQVAGAAVVLPVDTAAVVGL